MRLQYFLEGKMKQLHMEIETFLKKNPKPKDEQIHALADKLGIDHDTFEEYVYKMLADKLKEDKMSGGLADKMKSEDFDASELKKGIKHELEHTDDKSVAKEIAMDHLAEDPKYYTHLEKMEEDDSEQQCPPGTKWCDKRQECVKPDQERKRERQREGEGHAETPLAAIFKRG